MLTLVATFATLVPGGPVETRDFKALGGAVFWGFNVYLIALGLTALLAGGMALKGKRSAGWLAIICGWNYLFVVFLDLGEVFPRSSDPMPFLLGVIEILDAILAAYAIVLGHRVLDHFGFSARESAAEQS
ncbi:hypothetical protein D8780_09075 [Notoacmeibacter ruber]|uniref:DUF8051 domain-containing protein n=1 Tax=Notoacmeibacter ruber TaxID=2670375 RepID=A0A3L7JIQ7_9HYPH|nr:hypothetical protein D8780_09075 [Notoacmeibacter ruber]